MATLARSWIPFVLACTLGPAHHARADEADRLVVKGDAKIEEGDHDGALALFDK